jgi:predicted Zn-dependent peptidase
MQSLSDNTNTNQNLWNEQEIKELILYAKDLQQQNEDLQAKMIMMNAKLSNEESKVRQMNNIIKQIYAKGNNPYNSN